MEFFRGPFEGDVVASGEISEDLLIFNIGRDFIGYDTIEVPDRWGMTLTYMASIMTEAFLLFQIRKIMPSRGFYPFKEVNYKYIRNNILKGCNNR